MFLGPLLLYFLLLPANPNPFVPTEDINDVKWLSNMLFHFSKRLPTLSQAPFMPHPCYSLSEPEFSMLGGR